MLRGGTTGKVTAASPLEVEFDGDDGRATRVKLGASTYTPAAGDRVFLLKLGVQWVVVDKVVDR